MMPNPSFHRTLRIKPRKAGEFKRYTSAIMNRFLIASILVLTSYSPGYAASDSGKTWGTFQKNNSILGFTLGKNTIEEIVGKMGGELPNKPEGESRMHELASVCFIVRDEPLYLVFTTGMLHDYSTLYGFQISTDVPGNRKKSCAQYKLSKEQNLTTNGGLHIGQSKSDVLKLLNSPSVKNKNNWAWKYENYFSYGKPQTSSSEAGPTNSKYLMKVISKGEYDYGSITVKFSGDKVVDIKIDFSGESDFTIEHYDLKTGERIE